MEMNPQTKQAYQLLHEGTLALARAERQGMRVDVEYCERKQNHLTRSMSRLEGKFLESDLGLEWRKLYGQATNINSDSQLGRILYSIRGLTPPKSTATGKGSTDEESLSQLPVPELKLLLQMRKLRKLRDTYLDGFYKEQVDGVLHPYFNLHTVQTFRSSSDRPNFQNIPKRDKDAMEICRRALFPRKGHQLVEVDYSGIEVRIAATYHKDPTMLKYILDPTTDMHGDMAKQIFLLDEMDKKIPAHKTLRNAAKNGFVFPQFYGDYYINCAENLACRWGHLSKKKWKPGQGMEMPEGHLSDWMIAHGIKSFDQFVDHIKQIEDHFWNVRFRVYQKWKEKWLKAYHKKGYFDMHTGFRCCGVMGKNDAINYPVQGAAFHCLLWSFVELDRQIFSKGMNTRLIGQIHDAIVLDMDPAEKEEVFGMLRKVMCEDLPKAWTWINVPLDIEADIGDVDASWADIKPVDI